MNTYPLLFQRHWDVSFRARILTFRARGRLRFSARSVVATKAARLVLPFLFLFAGTIRMPAQSSYYLGLVFPAAPAIAATRSHTVTPLRSLQAEPPRNCRSVTRERRGENRIIPRPNREGRSRAALIFAATVERQNIRSLRCLHCRPWRSARERLPFPPGRSAPFIVCTSTFVSVRPRVSPNRI